MSRRWSFLPIQIEMSKPNWSFIVLRNVTLVCTLLLCMAWLGAASAFASVGGRSGFSSDPSTNGGAVCTVCHAPDGAATPTISILGPNQISAGTTQSFSVVISGGPAHTAGVDISAQNRIGELLPAGSDLYQLNGELTHNGPKNFNNTTTVTFAFSYKAPNYNTQVTLYAAGNSTNGAVNLLGDGIANTSRQITVVNGFEPPPDPPPPAVGELSATLFATGFTQPLAIANAGDDRLFVVERAGVIKVVNKDGSVLPTPFLDIRSRVDTEFTELGLLGLAFHPNYKNNGYFYVYYIHDPGAAVDTTRVSRFKVSSSNPNVADPNSELVLMEYAQPFSYHKAGDLHFDPSGYLNIASGDGNYGDPENNAQNPSVLLGKILRIDVDTPPGPGKGPDCSIAAGLNYSIPAGNAYNDGKGGAGCDEVFALGFRNPWRFSIDRKTGAMWIGDVGHTLYEEVNYLPPGSGGGINFGWRCFEGNFPNDPNCNPAYLKAVYIYNHNFGCSVTGGLVYRGFRSPTLRGQYFFSDFCDSSIRALSGPPGNLSYRIVLPSGLLSNVATFGEDHSRNMYVAEINLGNVYRLDGPPPPGC
jgi:glucose/arabinose dehydrogenase